MHTLAFPIHSEVEADFSGTKTLRHVCYIPTLYIREPFHTHRHVRIIIGARTV